MPVDKRDILERVARGELTPEDAEALLEATGGDADGDVVGARMHDRVQDRGATQLRRIVLDAGFGAVSIAGDPDVAEAEIDGPHIAAIEGDALMISKDSDPVAPGVFAINIGGRRPKRIRFQRAAAHGITLGRSALRLRMNPSLELDVKLDAGPLQITGITAPIRARSGAGPITIDDVVAPVDAAVNAGAIRIIGRFDSGESRVRSDAGAIRVELEPGSHVRVSANAALGKVVLPGLADGGRAFGSMREVTIGDGTASLRVETAMGSIQVIER